MCDCVSYYSRLPVELFISLSLALGCGNFVPLRDYDHFNYETAFIHFGAGRQEGLTAKLDGNINHLSNGDSLEAV